MWPVSHPKHGGNPTQQLARGYLGNT